MGQREFAVWLPFQTSVVGVSDSGMVSTLMDFVADESGYGVVDLEKLDKDNLTAKAKAEMGENEKVQIIVAMTLAGHPPREIMKVVDCCRQYIDKIKRKYKNALIEIEAERNHKRQQVS